MAAVLADFGDARHVLPTDLASTQDEPMTPNRVTLRYRAPEILFARPYGLPSDMWSLGITFAELENGHVPFRQCSEISMLGQISTVLDGASHKVGYPAVGGKRQERSWGARYGMHFERLVDAMLVVDPSSSVVRVANAKAP